MRLSRGARGGLRLRASDRFRPLDYAGGRRVELNADTRQYTPYAATQLAPVSGVIGAIARQVAASRLVVLDTTAGFPTEVRQDLPAWADPNGRPSQYQNRSEWKTQMAWNFLAGGNLFNAIRDWWLGMPNHVICLPTSNVSVSRLPSDDDGDVRNNWLPYLSPGRDDGGIVYYVNGVQEQPYLAGFCSGRVQHVKLSTRFDLVWGVSPLVENAPAFRTALAADAHAELNFATGGVAPYLVTQPGNPSDENTKRIVEHTKAIRRDPWHRFTPLYLGGSAKVIQMAVPAEQLQLLDTRKFSWALACSAYSTPPAIAGYPGAQSADFRRLTRLWYLVMVDPLLCFLGEALTELLPAGYECRLDPRALLRAEPLEEARYHGRLIGSGIEKPSEARTALHMPPDDEIDERWRQQSAPAPAPEAPEAPGDGGGDSDSSRDPGDQNQPERQPDEPPEAAVDYGPLLDSFIDASLEGRDPTDEMRDLLREAVG